MNAGKFPLSVGVGERAVSWIESELDEWIQDKIDLRDENHQQVLVKEAITLKDADVIAWIKDKLNQSSLAESIEWLMKVLA
jgi:predicted DNA-binding transcriptional regulator AlpA